MNLYETLGISKDADEQTVKKAYRTLVNKHHPDKGGDEETFRFIQLAYEVLSDKVRRRYYDKTGEIKPENELEKEFETFISSQFLSIVEGNASENLNEDLVLLVLRRIDQALVEGENKKELFEKNRRKVENALKKIKYKGSGKNLVERVFQVRLSHYDMDLELLTGQMEKLRKFAEMVSEYDYNVTRELPSWVTLR